MINRQKILSYGLVLTIIMMSACGPLQQITTKPCRIILKVAPAYDPTQLTEILASSDIMWIDFKSPAAFTRVFDNGEPQQIVIVLRNRDELPAFKDRLMKSGIAIQNVSIIQDY